MAQVTLGRFFFCALELSASIWQLCTPGSGDPRERRLCKCVDVLAHEADDEDEEDMCEQSD